MTRAASLRPLHIGDSPRAALRAGLDILLVDDDAAIRESLGYVLSDAGHRVTAAADGAEAIAIVDKATFDVAICDIRLPSVDGLTVFRRIRNGSPDTAVILMTGYGQIAEAVASLREGACDYFTKPFDDEALVLRIDLIGERLSLLRELRQAREELAAREVGATLVGRSPAIAKLLTLIQTCASSDAPLVITGESGTGKELVARSLHAAGPRRDGPFVAVNCAALPETLLEAELFGHERGAFTGAVKRRNGRFKAADGGTLLLDEVGELSLTAQVKLLRVLQEGTIEPLGSDRAIPVDVRVLAATHRNLRDLIAAGRFREDLLFRLNVLEVNVPPLRERKDDLVPLFAHFLQRFAPGNPPGIRPRAWAALTGYSYPGNIREFAHALERAVVLSRGAEIDLEHLPREIAGTELPGDAGQALLPTRPLAVAVDEFEREYLIRALQTASAKGEVAKTLGISRKCLWQKLRRHGIPSTS